eukprot:jgi/Mesvir1/27861/Mv07530-RA.1
MASLASRIASVPHARCNSVNVEKKTSNVQIPLSTKHHPNGFGKLRLTRPSGSSQQRLWAVSAQQGANPTAKMATSSEVRGMKDELLRLLGDGTSGKSRTASNRRIEELVEKLEQANPSANPNADPRLPRRWRLLATFKPGEASADFFSVEDWQKYFFQKGPSPVQSLVIGNTQTVKGITQLLQFAPQNRFLNIADFSKEAGGILVIEARITSMEAPARINFRFCGGAFILKTVMGRPLDTPLRIPYPVPFELLGERANAYLETLYLDDDMRISKGNKGSIFVLVNDNQEDNALLEYYKEVKFHSVRHHHRKCLPKSEDYYPLGALHVNLTISAFVTQMRLRRPTSIDPKAEPQHWLGQKVVKRELAGQVKLSPNRKSTVVRLGRLVHDRRPAANTAGDCHRSADLVRTTAPRLPAGRSRQPDASSGKHARPLPTFARVNGSSSTTMALRAAFTRAAATVGNGWKNRCVAASATAVRAKSDTITIELKGTPFEGHLIDPPPMTVETSKEELIHFFTSMTAMRRLELAADQLYKGKFIRGFCHLYDGQEAVLAGMEAALTMKDAIITSYRDHCTHITRGGTQVEVLAELMGRVAGCSKGKGGSMHMYKAENNFYGGNGIVGAQVPLGAGVAFKYKYLKEKNVCIAMYGDGAAQQGQLYEALNMAALWSLPLIYVCENNQYGMGTSTSRSAKVPEFYSRGGKYAPGIKVDGMDVLKVKAATVFAKKYALENGPIIMEMDTYRYHGHSMSDPGSSYRTRDEISGVRQQRDPIENMRTLLLERGYATSDDLKAIEKKIKADLNADVETAKASPEPAMSELYTNIYVNGLNSLCRGVDYVGGRNGMLP